MKIILFVLGLALSTLGIAQLSVVSSLTPQQLLESLVGEGISVSNVSFNGNADQIGAFVGYTSNIGLDLGVVMASGPVNGLLGNAAMADNGQPGSGLSDADLLSVAQSVTSNPSAASIFSVYDAARLEFDFVPSANLVSFNFVFSSDEYQQYINSQFNDAFGFFVSGPGITGPYSSPVSFPGGSQNLALVPGTTTPITISSIYPPNANSISTVDPAGLNAEYFIDNTGGMTHTHNGFTVPITISFNVECGETYHFKFAIGDCSDTYLNTAVFFEAESFVSDPANDPCEDEPCNITEIQIYETECDGEWFNIDGAVQYTDPPNSGDLILEDCYGNTTVIDSYPFAQNQTYYSLILPADGDNCYLNAYFTADASCSMFQAFDVPLCNNCFVESTFSYEGCVGDNYSIQYNGITYNESNPFGIDTLNVFNGCDSIVTIDMVFLECAPIQPINPHMEAYVNGGTTNALNPLDTGFVDICLGDTIMFVATPEFLSSFENTGTGYSQDVNSNIDFAWNIEGVTFSNNDTIWYIPTVANGYLVNLIITDQYDQSAEITSKIRISMPPDFSGVYAAQDAVCDGQATEIYGGSNGQGSSFTIPGGSFGSSEYYAGLTYLPDGSGQQYAAPIDVSGYDAAATIQSESDLNQICITMEHSYAGDLEIWLQCPNGSIVPLLNSYNAGFLPGGNSGGSIYLGDPIDDAGGGGPGEGWEYCFSSVLNDIGPMSQNWANTIPAPNFGNNGPSLNPENIYAPESSFAMLSGCPINGEWTLFVQDNIGIDDGYIFGWGLDFNADPSGVSGYQNSVDSAWWSPNPTIIQNLGDSSIIVAPDSSGGTYTFNILDDFGCSYDTTIFVGINEVSASIAADPTEGCAPLIVTFDYTNSIGNSFYLDFGDGTNSYDSIPDITSHLYSINDNFTATLYANNEGCSDTAYVNINAGETTTSYVTDSAYCAEVYNWNGFLIYDSGTYTQEFQTANGCDSTVVLDITFVEIDFALDFSADQQSFTEPPFVVQFTNETPDIDDYIFSWDFGDGTTLQSNDINVFHEYTSNGTFSVTLYADDIDVDCSDTLLQADYIFTTGQSSIYENEMVTYQIHPNPTSNLIYIQSEVPLNNTFSIFDQQGRLIRKGILEGKDTQVSLEDLSRGAYTIQVAGGFKPTVIIKN